MKTLLTSQQQSASWKHSLHHNNNLLDANLTKNISSINIVNLKKHLEQENLSEIYWACSGTFPKWVNILFREDDSKFSSKKEAYFKLKENPEYSTYQVNHLNSTLTS